MSTMNNLPDHARVWLFPFRERLSAEEASRVRAEVSAFLQGWQAHKESLLAEAALLEEQVLVVAVDETAVRASGCSIDKLTHTVETIAGEGRLARASEVLFAEERGLRSVTRAEFQKRAEEGSVSVATRVFDGTLTTLAELRAKGAIRPVGESWHFAAFFS